MYDLKMDRAAPESTFSMRKGRSSLNVAMIGAVSCTTCLITMEVQAEREGLSGKGSLILWTLSSSRNISLHEISKKLDIDYEKVTIAIEHLRDLEILEVNKKSIILVDLKEKEIQKVYRYK